MHKYNTQIIKDLELLADSERASRMKQYLRNQFEFYGIPSSVQRAKLKPYLLKSSLPPIEDAPQIAKELYELPQRECQHFALEFLNKYTKSAPGEFIAIYEQLICTKSWWDTVDFIASNLVGMHFKRFEDLKNDYVYKWMSSDNFWLHRTSIIFQLKYKHEVDLEILEAAIEKGKGSKEFFIQKAIGWALRQYGKFNPDYVIKYVSENVLAPLSKREALKHLK